MILENLKIQKVIDKIILDGLKNGRLITSNEFQTYLTEELRKQDLSKPFFNFIPQNDSYTLDVYNDAKEKLEQDLQSFFETIVLCYKKLQYNILKYESIKNNKMNYIDELNKRLEELTFKYSPDNVYTQFIEQFLNLDNTSDESTVIIDCSKREAYLDKRSYIKKNLNNPIVSTSTGDKVQEIKGTTGASYVVTTKKQKEMELTLEYKLDKTTYISSLNFNADYIKPTEIRILVNDAEIYNDMGIKSKTIEINSDVDNIKIILRKNEADKQKSSIDDKTISELQNTYITQGWINEQNNIFEYYFIIKDLIILTNSYSDSGIFVSEPIELPNAISYIKIDPEDYIPEYTSINYSYQLDDRPWKEYEKHSTIYINEETKYENKINFSELKYQNQNFSLRQLYYLQRNIPEEVDLTNLKSSELTVGHNQWKREIYTYNSDKNSIVTVTTETEFKKHNLSNNGIYDPTDIRYGRNSEQNKVLSKTEYFLLLLKDENSDLFQLKEESYIDVRDNIGNIAYNELVYDGYNGLLKYENDEFVGTDNQSLLYKYTTYITTENTINLVASNCYFSGCEAIMVVDDTVFYDTYSLSPGKHKISIYIYPDMTNESGEITCYFDIAKKEELVLISGESENIQFNTIEELRFKKELNDKPVHYCINNRDILIDSNVNARYLISLIYTQNCANTIRVKAELKNGNTNYTPKLYGYNLIMG